MNLRPISLLAAFLVATIAHSGTITINMDSGSFTLQNFSEATLTGGNSLIDGDGAVIQLGYYDQATVSNNFLGTWVPLTGDGSANTGNILLNNTGSMNLNQTSVGDTKNNGTGNGNFVIQLQFDQAISTKNQNLPTLTTIPLAIRFYDATTIAGATRYNAVSNDLWTWKTPLDFPDSPTITITFDEPGTEFQDASGVAGNNAKTTLVLVPEPSSSMLFLIGLMAMAVNRHRRAA